MTHEIEFLAATAKIFRENPGLDKALEALARLAVPALADACAIQILDGFQNVEAVATARIDAEAEGHVSVSCTRFGEAGERDPSHAALVRELSAESNLVLPLASRGAVLGSIALGLSKPGGFGPERVRRAEDFAQGASKGVENLRLARFAARPDRDRDKADEARERPGDALPAHRAMRGEALDGKGNLPHSILSPHDVTALVRANEDPAKARNESGTRLPDVAMDITGRKERESAEAEAKLGRELLESALGGSPDSMVILDPAGRILYANNAALGFMGLESGKGLAGANLEEAVLKVELLDESGKPLRKDDPRRPAIRVLRGEARSASILMQLRGTDRRARWIENKAVAIADERGRTRHIVSIGTDVTGLKHAQDAVAAHEERLRLALDLGRIGVWEMDFRTGQLTWSDRMCVLHGLPPGRPPRDQAEYLALIHPEDREKVMSAILAVEGRDHFEVEYRIPGPRGGVRWFHSAGGCRRGRDGVALRFLGAAIEITQRKRAEDAALKLQERVRQAKSMDSIGRMAGGMSHDFNNLLTAINGYADLILSSAREESVRGFAANIRESGERAVKITQQILAYSQKQILETEIADVNAIVRYMIDLIRKLVDESILITPVLSPSPEPIRVDPGKLKQALLHVIMNAIDAMPHGGRLSLSTFFTRLHGPIEGYDHPIPRGDYVILEVADTGSGMEPEVLARIFEPYFTTKPLGVKSGLGLSMVQGIVKQHGGHIQVSTVKGAGTRFRMYFPPADRSQAPPEAA